MTTLGATSAQQVAPCWCCGQALPTQLLICLDEHSEVRICLDCTTFLQQRAGARRDELRPSAAGRTRQTVRGLRSWIIERQIHRWPVVGRLLQSLNRRLP